jgi:hypothetical protein
MRTDLNLAEAFVAGDSFVSDSDLIGFHHPHEIVEDPVLTVSRKRQLLAYWASDIHAVVGAPALRTYAFGSTVTIDQIMDALKSLDERVDAAAIPLMNPANHAS